MGAFNRGTILSTAIHEAYPGHYVQFLWMQHINSRVRKLIWEPIRMWKAGRIIASR
jgi:hypothetical protein